MKMNSEDWEISIRGLDTMPGQVIIAKDAKIFSVGFKLLAVEYLFGDSIKDVLNEEDSFVLTVSDNSYKNVVEIKEEISKEFTWALEDLYKKEEEQILWQIQ